MRRLRNRDGEIAYASLGYRRPDAVGQQRRATTGRDWGLDPDRAGRPVPHSRGDQRARRAPSARSDWRRARAGPSPTSSEDVVDGRASARRACCGSSWRVRRRPAAIRGPEAVRALVRGRPRRFGEYRSGAAVCRAMGLTAAAAGLYRVRAPVSLRWTTGHYPYQRPGRCLANVLPFLAAVPAADPRL